MACASGRTYDWYGYGWIVFLCVSNIYCARLCGLSRQCYWVPCNFYARMLYGYRRIVTIDCDRFD